MQFDVLLFDPPWAFTNKKTGGSHTSGAEQKYPTMNLAEIENLPVMPVAKRDAVLFLWVPVALKFSHAPRVAGAWGFHDYKTTVFWKKTGTRLGMGFWYRNMVEELLVFTRGDVRPFGMQRQNVIEAPAQEHSAKPPEARVLVEASTAKMGDPVRRLEGFARERGVIGWDAIGNVVTGHDIRYDLARLANL